MVRLSMTVGSVILKRGPITDGFGWITIGVVSETTTSDREMMEVVMGGMLIVVLMTVLKYIEVDEAVPLQVNTVVFHHPTSIEVGNGG